MLFPNFLRIAVKPIWGVCDLGLDSRGQVMFLGGSDAKLLLLLSQIFSFGFELVQPLDDEWGALQADGNWSGMLGMVHRREVDMALCALSITQQREDAVDFTIPYDIHQNVFATRLPRLKPKFITFLLPFSPGMWYMILASLLVMPLIFKKFLTIKYSLSRLFSYVLLGLLKGPANIKPVKLSDYIFLWSWFGNGICLMTFYSGVLLSFVTLPLKEDIVRDIYHLSRAVGTGSYRCMIFRGTMVMPVFKESGVDDVRTLADAIEDNEWFVEPTRDSVMKAITEGNTAVIASKPFFDDHFQDGVALSEDSFMSVRIGIALSKDFCCKKELDLIMKRILYAGFIEKIKHDALFLERLKNKESSATVFGGRKPLKVEDMIGAFSILIVGYIVSFAAFIAEMLWIKVQKYTTMG